MLRRLHGSQAEQTTRTAFFLCSPPLSFLSISMNQYSLIITLVAMTDVATPVKPLRAPDEEPMLSPGGIDRGATQSDSSHCISSLISFLEPLGRFPATVEARENPCLFSAHVCSAFGPDSPQSGSNGEKPKSRRSRKTGEEMRKKHREKRPRQHPEPTDGDPITVRHSRFSSRSFIRFLIFSIFCLRS